MSVGGGNTADLYVCLYLRCVMAPTQCVASLIACCYLRVAGSVETQWSSAGR